MTRKQAFIIEDNPELVEIYTLTLNMANYDAQPFTDGRTGLKQLQAETPDLLILDMNLPYISGHYIYKNVRADRRLDDMPIIISTANNLLASALEKELGPNDRLVMKPVSPRQLKELLDALG